MRHPLWKLSRPRYLLFASLAYILGAAMAYYLSGSIDLWPFLWGLACVLGLQLMANFLVEYFRPLFEPLTEDESPATRPLWRSRILSAAIVAMTASGVFSLSLFFIGLSPSAGLMLILLAVLWLAWAVPPLRLVYSGYGELILAILWANFLPMTGFLLQNREFHRLVPVITFPLTFLALATLLVENCSTFAADQKYERPTLLMRLTWPRAVPLHHFLLAIAYLLFAITPLLGLPWLMFRPLVLTVPFALAQAWRLQQIARGGRTLWKLSVTLAASTFGLTLYFLILIFWLH